MNKVIRKRKGEQDVPFMERCAEAAKAINGSVDAGYGPICPTCAPFGSALESAEILPYQACYNCTFGEDETPKARN